MNPIIFALRRPITVMVGIVAILRTAFVAVRPKAFDAAVALALLLTGSTHRSSRAGNSYRSPKKGFRQRTVR